MQKRKQYTKSRKGNRDYRSSAEKERKGQFPEKKEECANDPSWYTVSGQMTKDAASINFNNPSGIVYSLNGGSNGSFVNPGVMNIIMAPVPGYSEGLSSPVNIAAKNLYSWVRHANSGHANYDSPDLMLMIVAMANAYAYYGWMTRLYGILRVYSQSNRYLGANMVEACNVDSVNMLANLANFRAYINQYALKLSSLSVPATMSLFKRYMWMFSNVFMDENNFKAQFYMYQPAYFYKYDEYNGAGRLVPVPLYANAAGTSLNTKFTIGSIITYGDTLLGALIGSEDINIMSGDILKAYGNDNIWKLQMIAEDYAIAPMFSEEVLAQIHNTTFVGVSPLVDTSAPLTAGWDSFMVTQDPNIGQGCIICKPLVLNGGNTESNHILDFWKSDPTPDDVMVATRNMVCGSRWSAGYTAVWSFGTEIPMWCTINTLGSNGVLAYDSYFYNDDKSAFNTRFSTADAVVKYLSKMNYFNEHPQYYLVDYNSTSPYATIDAGSSFGEMSNFTIIDFTDLDKMHLTAILSEFAVPMLGNLVK